MIQADTDKLEILGQQLKRTASNCDDSWYLLRSVLNEMDLDTELMASAHASSVWEHVNEAVANAELLNETMTGLAKVLQDAPEQYEEIGKSYLRRMQQITEYMSGLKAMYGTFSNENRREWISEIGGEYLAPVHQVLKRQYQFRGVISDEI